VFSAAPYAADMFSHIVVIWTDPADSTAAEKLIAGAERYLKGIPGIVAFHAGRMVGSHRGVVDQSYQVALNVVFTSKQAQDAYQAHPMHVEFVEKVLNPVRKKVLVYDFE
jgi:hypothetical protein